MDTGQSKGHWRAQGPDLRKLQSREAEQGSRDTCGCRAVAWILRGNTFSGRRGLARALMTGEWAGWTGKGLQKRFAW